MATALFHSSKVIQPYIDKKDIVHFTIADAKYYTAEPGTSFIFSPEDVHLAEIKINGVGPVRKG